MLPLGSFRSLEVESLVLQFRDCLAAMMTMTELFYGPVEPTWIVHPHYPGFKRSNGYSNNYDPYTIYSDHAYTYRRNPYTQRNAVPSASAAQEGAALRPGQGVMHPYQTQYLAHGTNAANGANFSPMSPAPDTNLGGESQNQNLSQTRNVFGVQTLHFMMPLCCCKCEDRVREQLLDLDDVQRVACDQWNQKVTVTSGLAPEKLLMRLQKIKKRTTFWPQQSSDRAKVFNGNQQNQKLSNNENHVSNNDKHGDNVNGNISSPM
ncbi:uncharacterized protein [Physcomitrium patens]|nr:uncharacterized protein LOC112274007 isoform X1 [Physcomitrium patens]|eukprot:XP_024358899.1 uncharacterized protein LOC112274007 isoform X1 [Physcomitrella patens]